MNTKQQQPTERTSKPALQAPMRYAELQELVRSFEGDFTKFYAKGNKEAGIRLRKKMQMLRDFAKTIRNEVQELNATTEKHLPANQPADISLPTTPEP